MGAVHRALITARSIGHFKPARLDTRIGHQDQPRFMSTRPSITVVILCWHICLISESMGHHDSEIMDDRSID